MKTVLKWIGVAAAVVFVHDTDMPHVSAFFFGIGYALLVDL